MTNAGVDSTRTHGFGVTTWVTAGALLAALVALVSLPWGAYTAMTAPDVDATAEGTVVETWSSGRGSACAVKVDYDVDGRRYTTKSLEARLGWCDSEGRTETVRYESADPSRAYAGDLAPHARSVTLLWFGAVTAAVAVPLGAAALWLRRRHR